MRFFAAVNLWCGVLTTKAFQHFQAIQVNNESLQFVLAIRTSMRSAQSMLMPAKASTRSIIGTLRTRLIRSGFKNRFGGRFCETPIDLQCSLPAGKKLPDRLKHEKTHN